MQVQYLLFVVLLDEQVVQDLDFAVLELAGVAHVVQDQVEVDHLV